MTHLDYSFIRTEADNKVTLFIQAKPEWLHHTSQDDGLEMDIVLTDEKTLQIIVPNHDTYETDKLEALLYHSLAHEHTLLVFCNDEAEFIYEVVLEPLQLGKTAHFEE
jgi:hypothetical protein